MRNEYFHSQYKSEKREPGDQETAIYLSPSGSPENKQQYAVAASEMEKLKIFEELSR